MNYTFKEKTQRVYTTNDIMTAIKANLPKHVAICMNRFPKDFDDSARYTLPELNDIVEDVVDDSLYFSGFLTV